MRCKNCQYPLWRLRARQCPECGAPFTPGEFEFVPFSVRFLCPHCEQEYYGDGPRGHLVPDAFDCVKCGKHVQMNEMIVGPAAGVEEARTQTSKVPWLERKSRGTFRAWRQTVGMAMVAPGELMAALPREAKLGTAVWFMVITQALIWVISAVPIWALIGAQMVTMATGRGGTAIGPVAGVLLAIFAIGFVISLAVWLSFGLAGHVVLKLTGKRDAGVGRTLQAFAYSSGANVLTAIPCLGYYIGWIWWVVSATLMLRQGQRVSGGRAALAVVGPVVVAIAVLMGGYAYFVYWAISAGRTAMATATGPGTVGAGAFAQVQSVEAALSQYAEDNGSWPAHASLLVVDGAGSGLDFVGGHSGWSNTDIEEVAVGSGTLLQADDIDVDLEKRGELADMAAAAMAGTEVAHRLGDMVICVSPRDPVQLPAGLWVVVAWPDPSVSGNTPPFMVYVATSDGATIPILANQFDADLVRQNTLRTQYGLPALPHPKDVGVEGLEGPER